MLQNLSFLYPHVNTKSSKPEQFTHGQRLEYIEIYRKCYINQNICVHVD